jgi:hypothetical protein
MVRLEAGENCIMKISVTFILHRISLRLSIQEKLNGLRHVASMEGMKKYTKCYSENIKGTDHFGDLAYI